MIKLFIILLCALFKDILQVYSLCPMGCIYCSSMVSCNFCEDSYFLLSGSCSLCPEHCTSCVTRVIDEGIVPICTNCNPPAQISSQGICFLCHPTCIECLDKYDNCLTCKDGYFLSNSTCIKSPSCQIQHCSICRAYTDRIICISCLDGYFQFIGKCFPCSFPSIKCSIGQQFWNLIVKDELKMRLSISLGIDISNPPRNLSSYMNRFNFDTMPINLQMGWTLAALVYKYLGQMFFFTDQSLLNEEIIKAKLFYDSIFSYTWDQQIQLITKQINKRFDKNWAPDFLIQMAGITLAKYTTLTQCSEGYVLRNNKKCKSCQSGCKKCSIDRCLQCYSGYFIDYYLGVCYRCYPPCVQCLFSPYYCTKANLPKLAQEGLLITCSQNCLQCIITSPTQCTTCLQPFSRFPFQNGACYNCKQKSCRQCQQTNTSLCYDCLKGFVLVQGACQSCPQYCDNCLNSKFCYKCNFRFSLVEGNCQPCSQFCISCQDGDPTVCNICEQGFYLQKQLSQCKKCMFGCQICIGPDTCIKSRSGVTLFKGAASSCSIGCHSCSFFSPLDCQQCQPRYYNQNYLCFPCPQFCFECVNSVYCVACIENYFLVQGLCVKCQKNCLQCRPENHSACITCKIGYYLQDDQCLSYNCSAGCDECFIDGNTCLKCTPGFSLKDDGKCIKCLFGCNGHCNPSNIIQCFNCIGGFELRNNTCLRCPLGCTKCLRGNCIKCQEGFKIIKDQGAFFCDKICQFPCFECINSICIRCELGFIQNQSGQCILDKSCNPNCDFCPIGTTFFQREDYFGCGICPSKGCSFCLDDGVCQICLEGYFKNSDTNECEPCRLGCKTCFSINSCKTCISGYVRQIIYMRQEFEGAFFGESCISCASNCQTCSIFPHWCTTCKQNFTLLGHRCTGKYAIIFNYTLNQTFQSFLLNYRSQLFIQDLSLSLETKKTEVVIERVREGSTIVDGFVTAFTKDEAENFYNKLGENSVPRFTVLSFKSSFIDEKIEIQEKVTTSHKPTEQEKQLVIIIAGGSGGGLLILVVSILVVQKCRNMRKQIKGEVQEISRNQASSEIQIGDEVTIKRGVAQNEDITK